MKTATAVKPVSRPAALNLSGIVPVEFKVLVRPHVDDGTVTFKSGFKLLKPDETRERDDHASMEGDLVAVSPFAFSYEEWPAGARKPEPGDTVVFARYSGITIKGDDGQDYRLMNDKDVVAIRGGAR